MPHPDSFETPAPDSPRRSTGVVIAAAAICFVLLGGCVLCAGGLALPLVMRQRAVEAQRNAVEAEMIRADALRKDAEERRSREDWGAGPDEAVPSTPDRDEEGSDATRPLPPE